MTSGGHNRIGFKHSQESKISIGKAGKGRTPWNKNKKGYMGANRTSFKKGQKPKKGFKKGNVPWNKGKKGLQKHSEKTREKIREANKGSKSYRYIDGRSKKFGPRRYGDDWNQIRNLIYVRDNFTCQKCGITQEKYGKTLDIHHKIPFLKSFDNSMQNLVTLCRSCHIKEESRMLREG